MRKPIAVAVIAIVSLALGGCPKNWDEIVKAIPIHCPDVYSHAEQEAFKAYSAMEGRCLSDETSCKCAHCTLAKFNRITLTSTEASQVAAQCTTAYGYRCFALYMNRSKEMRSAISACVARLRKLKLIPS